MARPTRCRKIEQLPTFRSFSPDDAVPTETVKLTVDEFEALRLLDHEGLSQEGCATRMQVARTTVTAIYESARRKLAEALVTGRRLRICGGSYRLGPQGTENIERKGQEHMRIAIPYENGEVFQHFGHAAQFKLYDAEDGKIVKEQLAAPAGAGHGALAGWLAGAGVDALICGGIGGGAQNALREAGVKLYAGVQGSADEAAKALAEGSLQFDPDAKCDHHGEGHGEGHCHHGEGHGEGHCHHGEGHEGHCHHHEGEEQDCGHQHGDEGCRRHHGEDHDKSRCRHHHGEGHGHHGEGGGGCCRRHGEGKE